MRTNSVNCMQKATEPLIKDVSKRDIIIRNY